MNVYSTNIAIGGALSRGLLRDLLMAAVSSGTGLDWNEPALSAEDDLEAFETAIADAASEGAPLRLYNDSATSGHLQALEEFCRGHDLVYRREYDPDHGESGAVVWWQPGMERPGEQVADADGEPFVLVSDLKEAMERWSTPVEKLTAIGDLLVKSTPVDVPTLDLIA